MNNPRIWIHNSEWSSGRVWLIQCWYSSTCTATINDRGGCSQNNLSRTIAVTVIPPNQKHDDEE